MDALTARVRAHITARRMVWPGATVVAAVSGGPDSLCLLHVLAALRDELRFGLHVAHLDHRLRGAEAVAEAGFVAETARGLGLAVTVEAADVRALARSQRMNLHAAARLARYELLARVAAQSGAQVVATAHHADDQAETVLLHLLRGAGPAGLAGIRPVSGWPIATAEPAPPLLIRPLLGITRGEIERYCAAHGLAPRRDPSNDDRRYLRTRVRRELLPQLAAYNPQIVAALGRTAAACADEHALVEGLLDDVWGRLARVGDGRLGFDGPTWAALPPGLQRAALRRAYAHVAGADTLGYDDIERARLVAGGEPGRRVELPGGVVVESTRGAGLQVARPGVSPPPDGPQLPVEQAELRVPGVVALVGGRGLRSAHGTAAPAAGRWETWLTERAAAAGLRVRRRQPGDRLRPAGGVGSRRLQDVLTDARVPRELRGAWPIVEAGGEIAWVPGVRAAEGVLAAPGEAGVRVWVEGMSAG